MHKKKEEEISVIMGSDNLFKDLGTPEEALAKAELIRQISLLIKKRKLTQEQVSKLLKLQQPKVYLLLRGHIKKFSTYRLLRFLNALNCEVEIRIRLPRSGRKRHGSIAVTMG